MKPQYWHHSSQGLIFPWFYLPGRSTLWNSDRTQPNNDQFDPRDVQVEIKAYYSTTHLCVGKFPSLQQKGEWSWSPAVSPIVHPDTCLPRCPSTSGQAPGRFCRLLFRIAHVTRDYPRSINKERRTVLQGHNKYKKSKSCLDSFCSTDLHWRCIGWRSRSSWTQEIAWSLGGTRVTRIHRGITHFKFTTSNKHTGSKQKFISVAIWTIFPRLTLTSLENISSTYHFSTLLSLSCFPYLFLLFACLICRRTCWIVVGVTHRAAFTMFASLKNKIKEETGTDVTQTRFSVILFHFHLPGINSH